MAVTHHLPPWTVAAPLAGWLLLGAASLVTQGLFSLALGAGLIACVLAAVHHAEVVAHRVGEPYGTLVLALAVTVIEVALIVSLMITGGAATAARKGIGSWGALRARCLSSMCSCNSRTATTAWRGPNRCLAGTAAPATRCSDVNCESGAKSSLGTHPQRRPSHSATSQPS